MTVLSRGARNRRGGRRPGWLLLTVLLVLAIGASSALVFTNRVELLKLAVILSLWAAVVGAFVSVIYRRQSDADQARARDLKLVYDLQLDREISARREYELSVESHLRRELASELREQAADEVAALRAELAALRANLEILFDADLGGRPALEGDRVAAGGYGDWTRDTTSLPPVPGRVESSRITPVDDEEHVSHQVENPIIDVPEEPLAPPQAPHTYAPPPPPQAPHAYAPPPPHRRAEPDQPSPAGSYRGSHRRTQETDEPGEAGARPPVPPERTFAPPPPPPRPEPAPEPVAAQQWAPPPAQEPNGFVAAPGGPPSAPPRRGRHWTAEEGQPAAPRPEPAMQPPPEPAPSARQPAEAAAGPAAPAMSTARPPAPGARHRGAAEPEPAEPTAAAEATDELGGQHTAGQSVAELMARLQAGTGPGAGGGRRRRRED